MLPQTIQFPYNGQTYNIPTAGYATEESAIDAFLQQQNAPSSIDFTDSEEPTDVQVDARDPLDTMFDSIDMGETEPVAQAADPLDTMFDNIDMGEQPAAAPSADPLDTMFDSIDMGDLGTPAVAPSTTAPPTKNLPVSWDDARQAISGTAGKTIAQGFMGAAISAENTRLQSVGMEDEYATALERYKFANPDKKTTGSVEGLVNSPLYKFGEKLDALSEEFFPGNPDYQNTFQRKFFDGVGSMSALMASGLAGPVGVAMTGSAVNTSSQFVDAIRSGADFSTAMRSGQIAGITGMTEAMPIMQAFERLDKGTGGYFGKTVTTFIKEKLGKAGQIGAEGVVGAIEEGFQEGFLGLLNNFSAKDLIGYDPKRDYLEGVPEEAQLGGALGFVLNSVFSAVGVGKTSIQTAASARLFKELSEQVAVEEARKKQEADAATEQGRLDAIAADTGDQSHIQGIPKTPNQGMRAQPNTDIGMFGEPAANDVADPFTKARNDILKELPKDHGLSDRDIDRLANLRADSRGLDAGKQEELDLDRPVNNTIDDQLELELKRDFNAPGQFPDSGTQQELGLDVPDYVPAELRSQFRGVSTLPPAIQRGTLTLPEKKTEEAEPAWPEGTPTERESLDTGHKIWSEARIAGINAASTTLGYDKGTTNDVVRMVKHVVMYGHTGQLSKKVSYKRMKDVAVKTGHEDIIEANTRDGKLDNEAFTREFVDALRRDLYDTEPYKAVYNQRIKEGIAAANNPRIISNDSGTYTVLHKPPTAKKAEASQAPLEEQLKKGVTLFRGAYNSKGNKVVAGDIGSHFAPDSELAASKAGETGEVGEFTVRARNPITLSEPANGAWHNPVEVIKVLLNAKIEVPTDVRKRAQSAVNKALASGEGVTAVPAKGSDLRASLDELNALLRQRGHDAIVYTNEFEGDGSQPSVIVLDPLAAKHVKSTTKKEKALKAAEILPANVLNEYRKFKERGKPEPGTGLAAPTRPPNAAELERKSDLERERMGNEEVDILEEAGYSLTGHERQRRKDEEVGLTRSLAGLSQSITELGEQAEGVSRLSIVPKDPQGQLDLQPAKPAPLKFGAQGELTLPEGKPPVETPTVRPPAPPTPPTPPPTGTGGSGRNIPPRAVGSRVRNPLAAVAESSSVVGEPSVIEDNGDGTGLSVDGRTYEDPEPNRRTKNYFLISKAWRFAVDIARTSSLFRRNDDIKMTKDIIRGHDKQSRAAAVFTENSMNSIKRTYLNKTGKNITDAPREHQKMFTEHLRGNLSRQATMDATGVDDAFMDALHDARTGIAAMSAEMLANNMIPGEMRMSMQENLGSYITVSYAGNLMRRDSNFLDMMDKIPEGIRHAWAASFSETYIRDRSVENLTEKSYQQLKRQAKALGLFGRTTVEDTENPGASKDVVTLGGVEESEVKSEHLISAIVNYDGAATKKELENFMAKVLDSLNGHGGTSPKSRERSIERKLLLARNKEQLAADGYSEPEIAYMQATRALLLETVDPVTNVGITINKMMQTMTAHRTINDIAKLHIRGLVSIGKADAANGLTELLVPVGHANGDIRIPNPHRPGEMIYAAPQSDSAETGDGIYVSPELARVYQHMIEPAHKDGVWINMARAVSGWTKINMTALNILSHPRNILSASMIMGMRGHMIARPMKLMEYFGNIVGVSSRDLGRNTVSTDPGKARKQKDSDTIIEYFTRLGLWNDSVRSGPARELMTKLLEQRDLDTFGQGNTWITPDGMPVEDVLQELYKGAGKGARLANLISKKPMTMYRLQDEAPKAMAFMIERRRHAELIGRQDMVDWIDGKVEMTDANLTELRGFDRKIAKHITDQYPTYSYVPELLRAASRNLVVTSFPSFASEMWRNTWNDMRDIRAIKEGTGRYTNVPESKRMQLLSVRVVSSMVYHAATIALTSSMGILGATAIGLDPTDDDLEEAYYETTRAARTGKFVPEKIDAAVRVVAPAYYKIGQFKTVAYVPGETVTLRNLDFSLPTTSMMTLSAGLVSATEEILDGEFLRATKELLHTGYRVSSDFTGFDVVMSAALEARAGRTTMGSTIWDARTDSATEKVFKSIYHVLKPAVPGSKIVDEAVRFYRVSQEGDVVKEATNATVGIKDRTYRIDSLWGKEYRTSLDKHNSISNSTIDINRLLSSNKEMTDDEFISEYLQYEEARYNSFQDMRMLVRSGESLGLSDKQMQAVVDDMKGTGNPGGMTVRDIIREKYAPYEPTLEEAVSRYYPKRSADLSIDEKHEAQKANKGVIKARLRLIKGYYRQIKAGDFTQ